MNTVNQTKQTNLVPGYEPIQGYVIEKPLGEGGFGEVWLAQAPGGLKKAVKFVYGNMDEDRAKRELKSLERIRGINHPFLLTLERFEFVAGRLVIVTELADGSLEDVYKLHREKGELGIPRDRLLAYLHDAADALDYLNDRFQLQHLDVKPANFLIVGDHVKLADFGLLKDLGDVEQSIIGGLTPVYAAPEVFDGRPSSASDQYSLAIMYQELLTGARPFDGRTIAQLATQHIHTAPNLEPLPPLDRSIVAKALEKNSQRRYPGCREFVNALIRVDQRLQVDKDDPSPVKLTPVTMDAVSVPTASFDSLVKELPQIEQGNSSICREAATNTAIVIGLGGFGADLLENLHQQRAGNHIPGGCRIEGLLIDTDLEVVERVQGLGTIDGGLSITSLGVPLRTPHEYRLETPGRLKSVSRRWLYNIPRSRRTEGLRPLGRLAMVDHADVLRETLSQTIQRVCDSCEGSVPKIYVTASLGGGTGSGMVWDVCFLVRFLLDERGLADAEVIPLVVTPSLAGGARSPLQAANTYAALTELNYFLKPENSYPGDDGIGWGPVASGRSPLLQTYVLTSSEETAHEELTQSIAQYILIGVGKAGGVIDAARQTVNLENEHLNSWEPTVRSVGLRIVHVPVVPSCPRLAAAATVRALRKCYGRPSEARQLGHLIAEDWIKTLELGSHSLLDDAWLPLPVAEFDRWVLLSQAIQQCGERAADPAVFDAAFRGLAAPLIETDESKCAYVDEIVDRLRKELCERLLRGRGDLTSFVEAVQQVIESMQSISEMHQLAGPRRLGEAAEISRIIRLGSKNYRSEEMVGTVHEPGPVLRYIELKLSAERDNRLVGRLKELLCRLKSIKKALRDRATKLDGAIKYAQSSYSKTNDGLGDPWRMLGQDGVVTRETVEVAASRYCLQSLAQIESLDPVSQRTGQQIAEQLQQALIPVVQKEIDLLLAGEGSGWNSDASWEEKLQSLKPSLLQSGGGQRRILLVGTEEQRDLLLRQLPDSVRQSYSVFVKQGAVTAFIHEAQQIPLSSVLHRISGTIGSDPLVIGRLTARADLDILNQTEDC